MADISSINSRRVPFLLTSPPATKVLSGDILTLRSIQQERDRIDAVLTSPVRPLLTTHIIGSILVAAVVSLHFFPVVAQSLRPLTSDDVEKWSNAVAGLLIARPSGLLSFHTLQLAVLCRHAGEVDEFGAPPAIGRCSGPHPPAGRPRVQGCPEAG